MIQRQKNSFIEKVIIAENEASAKGERVKRDYFGSEFSISHAKRDYYVIGTNSRHEKEFRDMITMTQPVGGERRN